MKLNGIQNGGMERLANKYKTSQIDSLSDDDKEEMVAEHWGNVRDAMVEGGRKAVEEAMRSVPEDLQDDVRNFFYDIIDEDYYDWISSMI